MAGKSGGGRHRFWRRFGFCSGPLILFALNVLVQDRPSEIITLSAVVAISLIAVLADCVGACQRMPYLFIALFIVFLQLAIAFNAEFRARPSSHWNDVRQTAHTAVDAKMHSAKPQLATLSQATLEKLPATAEALAPKKQNKGLKIKRASSRSAASSAATPPALVEKPTEFAKKPAATSPALEEKPAQLAKKPEELQFSIVLPCAEEGEYAAKTVKKIYDRTPSSVLKEIIVVDDGSRNSMETALDKFGITKAKRAQMKVTILKHKKTTGLMAAKKTGGDAATGDVIVFFDCHVSTQQGWTKEIAKLIAENPKRMIVPAITDLDIDTWEEKKNSAVNMQCYLTWDADFKWFDDPSSPYVPVMSGGLLALSNSWWKDTGGYDEVMRGWGGENLDQSLRSWLCGGEILRASTSRVAHMWRTGDPRTAAKYRSVGGVDNRGRVVSAWYDVFKAKYHGHASHDVSNFEKIKSRLKCKPFVYFLWRFREIYIEGGIIPSKVFHLREKASGKCMVLQGQVQLEHCEKKKYSQMFHWANRKPENRKCCSGLRIWNSNDCLDAPGNVGPNPYPCDVTGQNRNQQYRLKADGTISHDDGKCLVARGKKLELGPCKSGSKFEEDWQFEPKETKLYHDELAKLQLT